MNAWLARIGLPISVVACNSSFKFSDGKESHQVLRSSQDTQESPVMDVMAAVEVPALEQASFGLRALFPDVDIAKIIESSVASGWMSIPDGDFETLVAAPDLPDVDSIAHAKWVAQESNGNLYHIDLRVSATPPIIHSAACAFQPPPVIGEIQPRMQWHWKGYETADQAFRYATTYSSPVVGDLDGDGDVEIVAIASQIFPRYSYSNVPALMVVLDAKSGSEEWNSIKDAELMVESSTTPAIIDLDKDGYGEIVTTRLNPQPTTPVTYSRELIVIDYKTKTVKFWVNQGLVCGVNCMPAVADLEGDGNAEIVIGNLIVSANGVVIASLGEGVADDFRPISSRNTSTLAELDPQIPGLEIIANGSQVFDRQGRLLWRGECQGFSAVSDLDRDGAQELICIGGGKVYRYDPKGVNVWVKDLPQNPNLPPIDPARFRGGAPNIGNFGEDEKLEIGTAGGDYYVVYRHDGTVLWQSLSKDRSSHSTGSTVFDFNGNGNVEVVYNDEEKLRIYSGSDGRILFEADNYSGTLWEYPVVANIDSSPSVEIVVSAPGSARNDPNQGGIKVFFDPSGKWVTSRRVWNQYSYYPSIVTDKLQIPATPPSTGAGFRVNVQEKLQLPDKVSAPDIAVVRQIRDYRDGSGSISGRYLVKNLGQVDSGDQWSLMISSVAADGGSQEIAEFPGQNLGAGQFTFFDVQLNTLEDGHDRMVARISHRAGNPVHECSDENNSVSVQLK
jgi:hypothetical protein